MPGWRAALWGLWLCLAGVVSILSLLPGWMAPQPPGGAPTAHFVAYAGLAAIAAAAFRPFRAACLAILSVACLGVLLEVFQIWIPGRTFEWSDILADWLGVMAGMPASWALRLCLLSRWGRACRP
ncbi:MAG: VanZ family protein [Acidobacteria bacterium]|nr:VanZ family protein [Acidobacteriota bacterium]